MDDVAAALATQQSEFGALLDGLDANGWHRPTRCEGWDVADVVLHVAQSDELAVGSLSGRFDQVVAELTDGLAPATTVDESAAAMVERARGGPPADVHQRWLTAATALRGVLEGMDLSTRVTWVAGTLSARTLATTRLTETWIHAGDVADALGRELVHTDRLAMVARLAWRTLPYAFQRDGLVMHGPVALVLDAPDGHVLRLETNGPPATVISGPLVELCQVAARRLDPGATALTGTGPDAEAVLRLIRTYA